MSIAEIILTILAYEFMQGRLGHANLYQIEQYAYNVQNEIVRMQPPGVTGIPLFQMIVDALDRNRYMVGI